MSEDVRSLLMDVLYLSDIYAYRRETEVTDRMVHLCSP